MLPRRRNTLLIAALSVLACVVVGYAAVRYVLVAGMPWGASLPWSRMEGLLGAQVITKTVVRVDIDPGEGRVEGEATLSVASPGGDGTQLMLLLNAGLDVESVTCDGRTVSRRRQDERILVQLPPETGACEVKIAYAGTLQPGNRALLVFSEDELLVDMLHFWYPLDLKSFSGLSVTAAVPEDFEVAWSGSLLENQVADGRRTVRWEESRPVLAAGLAAGRYEKISRVQGSIRCNIFGRDLEAGAAESWLGDLGDSYNYFHTQFGADGFNQLNLIVSPSAVGASHLGGPVIACNPVMLENAEKAFVTLAGQVARNWWGDTVSGRWFSSRPEAGEWLVTGLSEYSAWQALRTVKGRRAYLRHRESMYCSPEIPAPMKAYNLEARLQAEPLEDPRLLTVRGPCIAAMFAEYIGPDAFARACRNFMSVHRHTTVSYAALLHEMTLASEKPLDELVRVWFDRPGAFDYAVTGVAGEGGRVHVTIENAGDIPAFVPMELGLLTDDGYQVHSIDPGVHGDTVSFTVEGPLKRVVLDPEFALGDMRRANNTWPATQWPVALAVSRNGRIAMLTQTEWGEDRARKLFFFSLAARTPEFGVQVDDAVLQVLQWDPEGQRLALQVPGAVGHWRDRQWFPGGSAAGVFLGWRHSDPVFWEEGKLSLDGSAPDAAASVPAPPPLPGFGAVHPVSGRVAYVTRDNVLVVWDAAARAAKPVRDHVHPAGGLRWRGESNELVYFEGDGALVSLAPDSNEVTSLLQRNYRIEQARISDNGGRVAWVDPAGLLRAVTPGEGEPVYISLPGEVVDFAWEGDDALVAIVAAIPRRLPMRFHADYTLWRIPATTWRGVQLPCDPVQFAAAAGSTEMLQRP